MGVEDNEVAAGANIGQYDCHPTNQLSSQHWSVGPSLKHSFISNDKSEEVARDARCIGVQLGKLTRAQLKQADCTPTHRDQVWQIIRDRG